MAQAYNVSAFRDLKGTICFGGKTFDLRPVDYTDSALTPPWRSSALNAAAEKALSGLTAHPFAAASARR